MPRLQKISARLPLTLTLCREEREQPLAFTNTSYLTYPTNHSHMTDIFPQMGKFKSGPVLNVSPTVLSDGYSVDLPATASNQKFLGYADTKKLKYWTRAVTNTYGEKFNLEIFMPVAQISHESTHKILFDGQTLVLFPKSESPFSYSTEKGLNSDKNWNDLLLAQALRVEKKAGNKKLVVLVTATIVDTTGKRIHSDAEMSFAKEGVPPQPPQ